MMSQKKTMEELNRMSAQEFHEANKLPITIVLDEVRSMHNVGAVFRTADSFLVSSIYLCGLTPQPPHRDIQKTALGATETVHWKHAATTHEALSELKQAGYTIIAIEQVHHSISLSSFQMTADKKYALIFGHEVHGVQQDIINQCDAVIEIPQIGSKHSLNISVSVGVVLWELARTK
jgi:23S rRNA (guanosine2251-2'-O)-methyltransferase